MPEATPEPALPCEVAGRCGGCPWIMRPLAAQRAERCAAFAAAWAAAGLPPLDPTTIPLTSPGVGGLRDRIDLSFRRVDGAAQLGLYDLDGQALVPIGACPMASPPLRAFIVEVAADPMPIDRASLRLRVAPDGARGLWIDAANADIKALLDERAWLLRRLEGAHVELGQRRKPLAVDAADQRLRLLKHAALRPWFQTWLPDDAGELRPTPLYGAVGGFTQPGHAANRALVERVTARLRALPAALRWLELGAGSGNFTLPLAAHSAGVIAIETDPIAVQALERGADEAGLGERIDAPSVSMHGASGAIDVLLDQADALFADPPRSGLLGFLDVLAARAPRLPEHVLYLSCHSDSLIADAARLHRLGYLPTHLEGIDQFPHSPHGEWLLAMQRSPEPAPR